MRPSAWQIFTGSVYALTGLALILAAVLGVGGYVFYMVVWMKAPLDKVLFFSVPCALVLSVGAHASVAAARNAFRGKKHEEGAV